MRWVPINVAWYYALDHHVSRLAEDHANALRFADEAAKIAGLEVAQFRVDTNIVFLDASESCLTANEISKRLATAGIRIGVEGAYRLRAVTHLDPSAMDITDTVRELKLIFTAKA